MVRADAAVDFPPIKHGEIFTCWHHCARRSSLVDPLLRVRRGLALDVSERLSLVVLGAAPIIYDGRSSGAVGLLDGPCDPGFYKYEYRHKVEVKHNNWKWSNHSFVLFAPRPHAVVLRPRSHGHAYRLRPLERRSGVAFAFSEVDVVATDVGLAAAKTTAETAGLSLRNIVAPFQMDARASFGYQVTKALRCRDASALIRFVKARFELQLPLSHGDFLRDTYENPTFLCVRALDDMRIKHNELARYLPPGASPSAWNTTRGRDYGSISRRRHRSSSDNVRRAFNSTERALRGSFRRLYLCVCPRDGFRALCESGALLVEAAAIYADIKRQWLAFLDASNELLLKLPHKYEHPLRPADVTSTRLQSIEASRRSHPRTKKSICTTEPEERLIRFAGTTEVLEKFR